MEPGGLIILVALFVLFWLFVIRPQRRALQEQRALHDNVAVGDEIVTMGGLLGHVRGIDEERRHPRGRDRAGDERPRRPAGRRGGARARRTLTKNSCEMTRTNAANLLTA